MINHADNDATLIKMQSALNEIFFISVIITYELRIVDFHKKWKNKLSSVKYFTFSSELKTKYLPVFYIKWM